MIDGGDHADEKGNAICGYDETLIGLSNVIVLGILRDGCIKIFARGDCGIGNGVFNSHLPRKIDKLLVSIVTICKEAATGSC